MREKLPESKPAARRGVAAIAAPPIVIVGGGGAGLAAADMLRREGYDGPITMISAEDAPPSDRPNLSKDYLAGKAQDDWIPLRSPEYFAEQRIELLLDARVSSIDVSGASACCSKAGTPLPFGALLIATGADPVRLPIPGADDPHVHYLRSFADSRAIVDKARVGRSARWSSAPVSSGSKWRHRCGRAASPLMSSRRIRCRSSA